MRHLSSLLLSATAVLGANAFDASIFTFDSNRQAQHLKDPSVLDDVAPSLLALRTNSDDGLALERSDQETVGALNQLGGMPAPLFGEFGDSGNQGRYLIILEGVNQELGTLQCRRSLRYFILTAMVYQDRR